MAENRDPQPIACTLSASGAAKQLATWESLSESCRRLEQRDNGVSVWFDPSQEEALRAVAEAEARCCAFLSLVVSRDQGMLRLDIESEQKEARGVIDAIAGLASGRPTA
jgi:hypothetical protein